MASLRSPKAPRATGKKYDPKLAINGKFEDVIGLSATSPKPKKTPKKGKK